jgi:hypothetical protein
MRRPGLLHIFWLGLLLFAGLDDFEDGSAACAVSYELLVQVFELLYVV